MYRYIKRIIDFILSLFGIVALIPIFSSNSSDSV